MGINENHRYPPFLHLRLLRYRSFLQGIYIIILRIKRKISVFVNLNFVVLKFKVKRKAKQHPEAEPLLFEI